MRLRTTPPRSPTRWCTRHSSSKESRLRHPHETRHSARPAATRLPGWTPMTIGSPITSRPSGATRQISEAAVAELGVRLFGDQIRRLWPGRIPEGPPSDVFQPAFLRLDGTGHHHRSSGAMPSSGWRMGGATSDMPRISFSGCNSPGHHLFVCTPEVTANWRWHDQQLSSSAGETMARRYRFRTRDARRS